MMVKQFGFDVALKKIQDGYAVSRGAWNNREERIEVRDGEVVEWDPEGQRFCRAEIGSDDLLAKDWFSLTDFSDRDVLYAIAMSAIGGDDFTRDDVIEELHALGRSHIIAEVREELGLVEEGSENDADEDDGE